MILIAAYVQPEWEKIYVHLVGRSEIEARNFAKTKWQSVQQRDAVAKNGKRLARVQQPFAIGKLPGITLKFISRKKNRRALKASDDY